MELKEAKNILEERKFLLINSSMPDISLVTAIDTILNKLDNRNKVIENLLYQVSDYLDEDTIEYLREIAGKE